MITNRQHQFNFDKRGTLSLMSDDGYYWLGHIESSMSMNQVELTIEVNNDEPPSQEQIQLVIKFEQNWKLLSEKLFRYLTQRFTDTKWEKGQDELQEMYYIASLTLKQGNHQWWVVLESIPGLWSIFNFLPRFTICNDDIVWSNLE